jgi:hypothetical protein
MKFAKIVFYIAGIWGVLVIAPLFFLLDFVGKQSPPAITHAELYYGFVIVTLMWEISFFIIARDPARYRAFMIPPAVMKVGYATLIVLFSMQGRLGHEQYFFASVDYLLAFLFLIAFNRVGAETLNHHLRRE